MADLESQYAIYSITKTFTSIAIFQLQEKGKLNILDKVKDYLPQYEYLENISIRDLLTHQSGINNPIPLKWTHLATETDFDLASFILMNESGFKDQRLLDDFDKSTFNQMNFNEQREANIVSAKDGNNSLNTRVYSADKEETIILELISFIFLGIHGEDCMLKYMPKYIHRKYKACFYVAQAQERVNNGSKQKEK